MIKIKQFLFFFSLLIISLLYSCKKEHPVEINYTTTSVNENINVQHISFVNNTVGFACGGIKGQSGFIYKTIDGGASWKKIFYNSISCLYNVVFYNDSIGFACGENLLLLKTTDGGQSWINQHDHQGQPPAAYNSTLRSIYCVDDQTVYVAGGNAFEIGLTYRTYNAGNFWRYNTFDNELRDIHFNNKYNGFFAGYGTILKTNDSADSFNPLTIENDFFVSMHFINNSIGFASGYNGGIYKTEDGGNSWNSQLKHNNDIVHNRHFNQIKFIDGTEGYAVGNNGLILYTSDGGWHWKEIKKITDSNLFSVWIKNKHQIYITSADGTIFILTP
jgi:photosystem II stability/assembly factor-like uncharacterized protein